MSNLRLRVPLGHGESAMSFCSRLAFRNGCVSVHDFCLDMGMRFQDIVDGCPQALAWLSGLGGIASGALARFAVHRITADRFLLAGQEIARIGLRRSRLQVCPACLLEDQARWPALGGAAPFGRAEWLLSPIRTCANHNLRLVEIADSDERMMLHDFSLALRPHLGKLRRWVDTAAPRAPSRLETYLQARLAGAADTAATWLDALPFHAAARLSEILGAVDLHGPQVRLTSLTEDEWWSAGANGFGIAQAGVPGIRGLLARLSADIASRRGEVGPRSLFGRLYEWLAHETDDSAYEPVRAVMREHLIETLPVGPGENIFGVPVPERKLHSIHSASLELGAHPKRLRKLLHLAGLIPDDHARFAADKVLFSAAAAQKFLNRVSGAMSLREAGAYINAPRVQMQLLHERGIIQPFVRGREHNLKDFAFAKHDLDGFLERLHARASDIDDGTPGLADIPDAARQVRCSATDIVTLLLDGRLSRVSRRQGEHGYMSMLVSPAEVRPLIHVEKGSNILSLREVEQRMSWSTRVVKGLVDRGHLPSTTLSNPLTRLPHRVVALSDLEAFGDRYVSLHGLANEQGRYFQKVKKEIELSGVAPAFDPAEIHATFYRRADLPT